MAKIALKNAVIYSDYDVYSGKTVLINEKLVEEIVDDNQIPEDYQIKDCEGLTICPGLIDLQLYGDHEDLFSAELNAESLARISQQLAKKGTTSFMMTLATNTILLFKEAIEIAKSFHHPGFLGLHLEGPFLNASKRGAHPEELIIPATAEIIDDLLKNANSVVKMMTIAPELIEDDALAKLQSYNLILSAGHSAATFEQGTLGFDKGIQTSTHLFNAMSSLHHREAGLPGAIFNHRSAKASIIVDGVHVDFQVVKIAKQQMGERLFLITDAVAACSKGIYQHVLKDCYYALPEGTLSGAAISLLDAVSNCVNKVGISIDESIRMATTYPARILNRTDLGNLNKGSLANILVFDKQFKVSHVFHEGVEQ